MGQAGLVGLQLQSMCSETRDKFVTEYFMKVDRGGETAPYWGSRVWNAERTRRAGQAGTASCQAK